MSSEKEIMDEIADLKESIVKYESKIISLEDELRKHKSVKYMKAKFDYSKIDHKALEKLTIEQLQYIICDKLGPGATYKLRCWHQSIYSRIQCRGDITWFELSDEEYKQLLCKYIRIEIFKMIK